jgi:hypothetical protein
LKNICTLFTGVKHYNFVLGKSTGKRTLGRPTHQDMYEDNIKID